MSLFLEKFKKVAIASLLFGSLMLLVTIIVGGLCFNLDPITVFVWFSLALVVYFAALFIFMLLYIISWYLTPTGLILILGIAAFLVASFVFLKMDPIVDVRKILDDTNLTDSLFKFLKK